MPVRVGYGLASRSALAKQIEELRDLLAAQKAARDACDARDRALRTAAEAWNFAKYTMRAQSPRRESEVK
ncbi:MAG TPA: hypothetical protein VGF24_33185 [Vicinamibacterales bacterium]